MNFNFNFYLKKDILNIIIYYYYILDQIVIN